jgi:hypothetical protein
MALCESFKQLDKEDQDLYITMLAHAVKNDEVSFVYGKKIIEIAQQKGQFNRVLFGRDALLAEKPDTLTSETKDY